MIGTLSLTSHHLVNDYVIKVIQNEKWLIMHQEFFKENGLFRSIYLPAIEELSITEASICFTYAEEGFQVRQRADNFYAFFESLLRTRYN